MICPCYLGLKFKKRFNILNDINTPKICVYSLLDQRLVETLTLNPKP